MENCVNKQVAVVHTLHVHEKFIDNKSGHVSAILPSTKFISICFGFDKMLPRHYVKTRRFLEYAVLRILRYYSFS